MIRAKPTELLQAQGINFLVSHPAGERFDEISQKHFNDTGEIYDIDHACLGEIAVQDSISPDAGPWTKFYPGYVKFLREQRGRNNPDIQYINEKLVNYAQFKPMIDKLRSEVQDCDTATHPAYIDEGASSAVYSLTKYNEKYAIRFPNSDPLEPESSAAGRELKKRVAAMQLGQGHPQLEQMTAASVTDQVIVSPFIEGNRIDLINDSAAEKISIGHLNQLISTAFDAVDRGIAIDADPSNLIYNSEKGFTIIDYQVARPTYTETPARVLRNIIGEMRSVHEDLDYEGKSLGEASWRNVLDKFKAAIETNNQLAPAEKQQLLLAMA